jgi:flagellar protein FliO/FliZ
MFDLFGSGMPLAARFFIAFLVVLALIGLTAWLVRRFAARRLGGSSARGRQPRLAVIDAANVDGRRRLLLIRRDNIEHLLMIGGPTDIVIEPNIVRAAPAAARSEPNMREPVRSEPNMRAAVPAAETAWPLQPVHEPPPVAPLAPLAPVAPPRGYRAGATDEPWLPGEPGARPRPVESPGAPAPEPAAKPAPPELPPPPPPAARREPPPPPPEPPPQHDRNLAEMAMQLEAALRRPAEAHPPVTDPLAVPPVKVEAPLTPPRDFKPRSEPKFDARPEPKLDGKPEPKVEPKLEPKLEAKPEPKPEPDPAKAEAKSELAAATQKSFYDNLEEEMASLLGRPPGKS